MGGMVESTERISKGKRRNLCVKTNIVNLKIAYVTLVNVPKSNNVIVNKSFIINFLMSPFIWGIGIIILMILAW